MRKADTPYFLPEEFPFYGDINDVYDPVKDIHGINAELYIERTRVEFRHDWWSYLENFYS